MNKLASSLAVRFRDRLIALRPVGKPRSNRDADLRRTTGFTLELYEKRREEQGNTCAICGRPPKKTILNADHDHATGTPRGLLCPTCNSHVGWYEKIGQQKIQQYLNRYPATGPADPSRYGGLKRPSFEELRIKYACPDCGAHKHSKAMVYYYSRKGRKPTRCEACAKKAVSKKMLGNRNATGVGYRGFNSI